MIGEQLVREHFKRKFDFDVTLEDVRIIARRGGVVMLDQSYPAEKWKENSALANSIRSGLDKLFAVELDSYKSQLRLEAERFRVRTPHIDELSELVLGVPRMPSEADLVSTWVRNIVGFERERPRVSVSNIARTRLKPTDSVAKKSRVHQAREILRRTKK